MHLAENYRALLLSIPDDEITDEQFDNCVKWFVEEAWKKRYKTLDTRRAFKPIKAKISRSAFFGSGLEQYYQPFPEKPETYYLRQRREETQALDKIKQSIAQKSEGQQ